VKTITETEIEEATLEWLEGLDWNFVHGPDIAAEATCVKFAQVHSEGGLHPEEIYDCK